MTTKTELTLNTPIYVIRDGNIVETTPRDEIDQWAEYVTSPQGIETALHLDGLKLYRYYNNSMGARKLIEATVKEYNTETEAEIGLDEALLDEFRANEDFDYEFSREQMENRTNCLTVEEEALVTEDSKTLYMNKKTGQTQTLEEWAELYESLTIKKWGSASLFKDSCGINNLTKWPLPATDR